MERLDFAVTIKLLTEPSYAYEPPAHMAAWYCEECDIRGQFSLCFSDDEHERILKLAAKHVCKEERFNPSVPDYDVAR